MTLQALGYPLLMWPNMALAAVSTSIAAGITNYTLDAADEACGIAMHAPKTGNIDRVKWRTGTWTTAGTGLVNVGIEAVGSTGLPAFAKSLFAAGAEGSHTPVATNDNVWLETTLGTPCAVTQGAAIAVVIRQPSANVSNFQINALTVTNGHLYFSSGRFPQGVQALGAPPTVFTTGNGTYPMVAIRYDDGTWYCADGVITGTGGTTTYNSGTNPRYRGNRFQVPFKCRATGIWAVVTNVAAAGDFIVRVRDNSGSALASSGTFDGDYMGGTTNDGRIEAIFTADVDLNPGTWYRMTIEPQSANNITILSLDVNNADIMAIAPGGTNFYMTTSNDLSTWSDTTTQKHVMGLVISALDDGAGGGGGLALPPVRAVA